MRVLDIQFRKDGHDFILVDLDFPSYQTTQNGTRQPVLVLYNCSLCSILNFLICFENIRICKYNIILFFFSWLIKFLRRPIFPAAVAGDL